MKFNDIKTEDPNVKLFQDEYTKSLFRKIIKKVNNEYFDQQQHENSLNFGNFTRCELEDNKIVLLSYQLNPVVIEIHKDYKDFVIMYIGDTTIYSYINSNIYAFVEMCKKECAKYNKQFFIQSRYFKFPANKFWIFEKKYCNIIPHLMVSTVTVDTKHLMFESAETYVKFKKACSDNIHIEEIKLGNQLADNWNIRYYIPICEDEIVNGRLKLK